MAGIRDPEKRPLYVDRKNGRFFAEPVLGTPWKEVTVVRDYTAGDGLDLAGTEFSVDLKAAGGLAIDSGELALSLKANGGVVLESGALAVDLGASSVTGTLGIADGGTGQTSYTNGQLLIGNASGGLTKASLTAGSNITITPGDGSITIAAAAYPSYSAGDGLDLTGTSFSVDLKANGGLVIESTELALDLGASAITGTLGVGDGGTGQTSYTDGQLLIGNSTGNTLTRATLTAGAGILVTNGSGSITIANTGPALDTAQTWTKGQRGEVTTLVDGASIAVDLADSNHFTVTLGGNRTLANPTNAVAGQSGVIFIVQDGAGNRTLGYGANWHFPGGVDPVLSTAANAVDMLSYVVRSATSIVANLVKDVK